MAKNEKRKDNPREQRGRRERERERRNKTKDRRSSCKVKTGGEILIKGLQSEWKRESNADRERRDAWNGEKTRERKRKREGRRKKEGMRKSKVSSKKEKNRYRWKVCERAAKERGE